MSRQAQVDLLEAYEYIATGNPAAAITFLADFTKTIEWMASIGLTGVERPFIPGLRAFSYRQRCIYFMIGDAELVVLRIMHGRQHVTAADFPESDTD